MYVVVVVAGLRLRGLSVTTSDDATGGYDHSVRLWEASTGKCHRKLPFADSQVNCLEITTDKRYIAAAGNPNTRIYDTENSDTSPLRSFDGHVNNVNALGFHQDGRWMFTGCSDGALKIWDLRAPSTAREFGACQREYDSGDGISTAVLHPNQGENIAGDESGTLRVFDLTQDQMSYVQQTGVGSAVRSISIAADASVAATAHDNGQVVLWWLPNGKPLLPSRKSVQYAPTANKSCAQALKCRISPDMSYLATTSADSTIKMWHVDSLLAPKERRDLATRGQVSDSAVRAAAAPAVVPPPPPPQPMPAAAEEIKPARILSGHDRWVWDCVFSADSAYLVSASSDATARLWDLSESTSIREYAHSKAVTAVALSDIEC